MKKSSRPKSLETFVRQHRQEIDKFIRAKCPNIQSRLNDQERGLWVLNEETLYMFARSENTEI